MSFMWIVFYNYLPHQIILLKYFNIEFPFICLSIILVKTNNKVCNKLKIEKFKYTTKNCT